MWAPRLAKGGSRAVTGGNDGDGDGDGKGIGEVEDLDTEVRVEDWEPDVETERDGFPTRADATLFAR